VEYQYFSLTQEKWGMIVVDDESLKATPQWLSKQNDALGMVTM
jgi:hypothetical protein